MRERTERVSCVDQTRQETARYLSQEGSEVSSGRGRAYGFR